MADKWTATSDLAKAVYVAGFEYDPVQDIIYSRMYAHQRDLGYTWAYDVASPGLQMIIDCEPIYFRHAGKAWMIELWKGQYGLETGAEIGVYYRADDQPAPATANNAYGTSRGPPHPFENRSQFYTCVSDPKRLKMSFRLYDGNGKLLFQRGPELHWWLTGFKWGVFTPVTHDLRMELEIFFPDAAMRDAFEAAVHDQTRRDTTRIGSCGIAYTFQRPRTLQPGSRVLSEHQVQARNQHLVDGYLTLKKALKLEKNDPNDFDGLDAPVHQVAQQIAAVAKKIQGHAPAATKKLPGAAAAAARKVRDGALAVAGKVQHAVAAADHESEALDGKLFALFDQRTWHSTYQPRSPS